MRKILAIICLYLVSCDNDRTIDHYVSDLDYKVIFNNSYLNHFPKQQYELADLLQNITLLYLIAPERARFLAKKCSLSEISLDSNDNDFLWLKEFYNSPSNSATIRDYKDNIYIVHLALKGKVVKGIYVSEQFKNTFDSKVTYNKLCAEIHMNLFITDE